MYPVKLLWIMLIHIKVKGQMFLYKGVRMNLRNFNGACCYCLTSYIDGEDEVASMAMEPGSDCTSMY